MTMLVAVREYTSASEMVRSLMAIRHGFLDYCPPPAPIIPEPDYPPEPVPDPDFIEPVIFCMTPDMATPPEFIRPPRYVTVHEVVRTVCEVWRVDKVDLLGARRHIRIIGPRKAAYALACKFTPFSLPHIGRQMGGRDHTTVLSGRKRMQPIMDKIRACLPEYAGLREWAEAIHAETRRC